MDERYKQLSYIQSSGNQYINTGLHITSGRVRMELQYEYITIGSDEDNIIGSFNNWPSSSGLFAFGSDGSGARQRSIISSGRNFRSVQAPQPQTGVIYTSTADISSSGQSITVNGTSYTGDGYTVGSAESIYIFCNGGEVKHFASVKLYYLKIWDDNTLIADYIPAVDTEEGVGGLYNTLDDTFLKSGNGDFEYTTWVIKDDSLSNIFSIPLPTPGTPPAAMWRIESGVNLGFPYNDLMIGLTSYTLNPVEQDHYVCVYDMWTPQTGFDNNGLAILGPTSCKVTEQLNGGWAVTLEHPIDSDNKWEYIKQGNYLKVLGQLFTINKVELSYSGNSGKLTAWGEHVFYQLNDPWIPEGTRIVGTTDTSHAATGNSIISAMMSSFITHNGPGQMAYNFGFSSDMVASSEDRRIALFGIYKWDGIESGMTPIDFLLGNNGFISSFGGELYRDNFYFSINSRMEHSQDSAFELRAGLNVKSIRRTVDLSTYCTYFKAYTDDGYWWAVAWDPSTVIDQYPHNIVREKKFSINTYGVKGMNDFESRFKMMLLVAEGQAWFSQNCMPFITYVIDVKDMIKNKEYSDVSMFRFKVGDKGRIYDERFGRPINVEITKTVTDGITGEVTQVQFGSTRSFTRTSGYKPIEESDIYVPVPQAASFRIKDSKGRYLKDSNNKKIVREVELNG